MPTTLTAPSCLHIPPLQCGGTADISWESIVGYELECVYNGSFDDPGGATWQSMQSDGITWQLVQDQATSWSVLESPPEIHLLYRGPGTPAEGNFFEPDKEHTCHEVEVPSDVCTVQYRLRTYCGDAYSPYLTSEIVELDASNLTVDGSVQLPAATGKQYAVQVNARDVADFENTSIRLAYPSELLSLRSVFLDAPDQKTDLGGIPYADIIQEVSSTNGAYTFRCVKDLVLDTDWSGLVVCFLFDAVADGVADITLSKRQEG